MKQYANVLPPKLADIMNMDKIEHEKMECLSLFSSVIVSEKASTFLAYTVKSSSLAEVGRAYRKVLSPPKCTSHCLCTYHWQVRGFKMMMNMEQKLDYISCS